MRNLQQHQLRVLYRQWLICWGTHPDHPNRSGHARGRVWHLIKDFRGGTVTRNGRRKTLCGNLFDGHITPDQVMGRVVCQNCLKEVEKIDNKEAPDA